MGDIVPYRMWSCLLDREVILPIFDMTDGEGDRLTPGSLGKRLAGTPAASLAGAAIVQEA